MDKMKLIEELKKKKEIEKTEVKEEVSEVKEEQKVEEIPENISISKKRRNRRRSKKKSNLELVSKEEVKNTNSILPSVYDTEKFKKFKEEFLKDDDKAEFIDFLNHHKEKGDLVFEPDFFILQKMLEPKIKTVIIDPSIDDMARGVGSKFYLAKPMYNQEYVEFVKEYGPREEYPEEFMIRMFETSLIFPENLTKEDIKKMPTGTVLSIYRVILDLSDFNKTYRIIEV